MIPRAYKGAAILLAAIVLYSFAWCSGKKAGAVNVEDKSLKAQVDSLHRVAKNWKEIADAERDSRIKLAVSLTKSDSVVRVAQRNYARSREVYRKLRDSIQANEPDSLDVSLIEAVDRTIEAADSTIRAQDIKIGQLEEKSASQDREIFALRNLNTIREQELAALNRRLAVSSKRIGNARRQGAMIGFGVASFIVMTAKGMQ